MWYVLLYYVHLTSTITVVVTCHKQPDKSAHDPGNQTHHDIKHSIKSSTFTGADLVTEKIQTGEGELLTQ